MTKENLNSLLCNNFAAHWNGKFEYIFTISFSFRLSSAARVPLLNGGSIIKCSGGKGPTAICSAIVDHNRKQTSGGKQKRGNGGEPKLRLIRSRFVIK